MILDRYFAYRFAVIFAGVLGIFTLLIGFVGLVVPHAIRLISGPDYRHLLPMAALGGAALLLLADAVSRVLIAPAEVPVGIMTALLGAPFFVFLLVRLRRTFS